MKTQLTPKQKEYVDKYLFNYEQIDDNQCGGFTKLQIGDIIISALTCVKKFSVSTEPLIKTAYISTDDNGKPMLSSEDCSRFEVRFVMDYAPDSVPVPVSESEYEVGVLPLDVVNQRLGHKFIN